MAGDDLPEVDVFDGVGDDLGRVLGAGVGAVELVTGQDDSLVGEVLVWWSCGAPCTRSRVVRRGPW